LQKVFRHGSDVCTDPPPRCIIIYLPSIIYGNLLYYPFAWANTPRKILVLKISMSVSLEARRLVSGFHFPVLREPRLRGADLRKKNFKARVSRISSFPSLLASPISQASTECLIPCESSLSGVDVRLHFWHTHISSKINLPSIPQITSLICRENSPDQLRR